MDPEQMDPTNGIGEQDEQNAVAETPTENEPTDLASAFLSLRNDNTQMAESDVAGAGESDDDGESDQQIEDPAADLVEPDGEDAGGPADGFDGVALEAARRDLINSANRQAQAYANEQFQKQGIRRFSVQDLYQRDEQSGRVTFNNPDDPSRPFQSRTEAMQWVDAINKQIDQEWQNVAAGAQRKYLEDVEPAARMLDFAPRFEQMNEDEQAVFDDLISPYEIKRGDKVIGYSCDLDAAMRQAQRISARYASQTGNTELKASEPSGPAMDMPSKGSEASEAGKPKEPSNLAEAMAMYQKQKRERQGE